ncbi:MAG: hypothetical protein OER92_02475 [Alphaproteobacteria bacterium]|nr:hypothetical protein [Alphaproteobacteria bacterium]
MSTNRPASLSSALLARKGAAMPTGYTPLRPNAENPSAGNPVTHIAPVAATFAGPAATDNGRVRVSVRLDRERHLKLKLTAAHLDTSLQDIIIDALDRYLEELGPEVLRSDCSCLGINNLGVVGGAGQRDRQPD